MSTLDDEDSNRVERRCGWPVESVTERDLAWDRESSEGRAFTAESTSTFAAAGVVPEVVVVVVGSVVAMIQEQSQNEGCFSAKGKSQA